MAKKQPKSSPKTTAKPVTLGKPAKAASLATQKPIPQPDPQYCTDEEPDCCEGGDPGDVCPGCGKIIPEPPKKETIPVVSRKELLQSNAKAGILNRSQAKELEALRRKEVEKTTPTAPPTPFATLLKKAIHTEDTAPHIIVTARAGTGKTTTLVEGLKELMGIGSALTPSPQQRAVWDAICLSKGKAKTVGFVAFNKSIAEELQRRVPAGCDAMTMHSMGFRAINKSFRRLQVSSYRVQDFIGQVLEVDIREFRRERFMLVKAVESLVGLCKMNLVDGSPESLESLVSHYEIEVEPKDFSQVYELVPKILELCRTPDIDGRIDYDDMIWLPVVLGLSLPKYDLLLVDEAQDLNRCQQALAKVAGKRLILCGDPKQAIYGFAGADSESMDRMYDELSQVEKIVDDRGGDGPGGAYIVKSGRGCIQLPLTVTRRCGKAIVREANKIVPDFEAFETNPEGFVTQMRYQGSSNTHPDGSPTERVYSDFAQDGDMVLCRVNAPLVSQCFRFLKTGRKATIVGRDIGQGLISLIKKLSKKEGFNEIPTFIASLTDWSVKESAKEQAKRNPNESRIIAIQDRVACLLAFTEGCETLAEVIRKIESIFTDRKDEPGIRLSSIHKAKGLEAKRVFLLQPKGATVPHPMAKTAWQKEQEYNLLYVAITRAIEELVYVS